MDLKKVLEEDEVIALTVMLGNGAGVAVIDKVEDQDYHLLDGEADKVDCFLIHFIPADGEDFSVEYIALDVDGVLDTLEALGEGIML